jgi:RimJ/RimL family protein N-acetyltransferase
VNVNIDSNTLPLGPIVPDWKAPPRPGRAILEGRYCRLEPIDSQSHADSLFAAFRRDSNGHMWTYRPYGPFETLGNFQTWIRNTCCGDDPCFFAIVDLATGKAAGMASFLRIDPASGSIEVGHILYSPLLQRTRVATEAMYLMMSWAFDAGYRRYEWKCDALHAASRSAAQRLGFSYEGTFRQATIVNGRNRDTAWYAIIDKEWPALRRAFTRWLDPENFDGQGMQKQKLSDFTSAAPKLQLPL